MLVTRALAAGPHLALVGGDLVLDATELNFQNFFAIEEPLVARVNLLPVLGNHEGDGALMLQKFVLPSSSPGGERYWVRRFGSLAVLGLDNYSSTSPGSEQYNWLSSTLASLASNPDVKRKFVLLHEGPYDSGPHGSNLSVRNDFVPLFKTHKVDIVFSGHDHDYERGTVDGIKYVVTGAGGADLYTPAGDTWTEVMESTYEYTMVEMQGAKVHYRAYRALDGSVLDEFWLGQEINECSLPADCSAKVPGSCEAPDLGAWACAGASCVWNCTAPVPVSDAGAGGSAGTMGSAGSAGASGSGQSGAGGSAGFGASVSAAGSAATAADSGPDSSAAAQAGAAGAPRAPDGGTAGSSSVFNAGQVGDDDGGCGCRTGEGGTRPGLAASLLALLALGIHRRRRLRTHSSGALQESRSRPSRN
jgi:MYXO-CTERM domain-containing protein